MNTRRKSLSHNSISDNSSAMADDDMNNEDEVWDSWEDMVDCGGLDKRLEKEEQSLQETRKNEAAINAQPIVLEEDTHRTKYQPTLKLMRRETDGGEGEDEQGSDETQDSKLIKSLAERQTEYAEARLRILGSAKNEDEQIDKSAAESKSNSSKKKAKSAITSKKGPGPSSKKSSTYKKGSSCKQTPSAKR